MTFFFQGVQATPMQHQWIEKQLNPTSIIQALPSKVTSLPFNPIDGSDFGNEQDNSQRFDINIGSNYVLPFIDSIIGDTNRFNSEEKATIMAFITSSIQNLLSELKIQSDDLVHLLDTLIVKDEVTTLQRLSMMTDNRKQARFVDLLTVIKVHQSNIAAVQDVLKSYQTIDVWRTSLQRNEMTYELVALYYTVSSISNANNLLWREFYLILNM